jgi:asparagine synthase (glutamine-hydrolysing)
VSEALPLLTPPGPAAAAAARAPALVGRVGRGIAGTLAERREGPWRLFTAPGIEVRLHAARGDAIMAGQRLTLSVGGDAAAGHEAMRTGDLRTSNGAIVDIDLATGACRLATDRFATQPLCYGRDGEDFVFSDRADAVPGHLARALDPQAIYNYLYFHVIPAPDTVFQGVKRLEPATLLRHERGAVHLERCWTPQFAERRDDSDRLADEFVACVREAVARRADDRTGCFLSGGTDSSTVAGMLSRLRGRPVDAFSIGFNAEGYDEMAYARIAARHFGLQHHEYYVTPEDLVRGIPQVAAQFDQPFGNSSAVPAHFCALLAREHGIERMLAGDGGDELFGGNTRYAKQKVFDLYGTLPAGLRHGVVEPLLLSSPAAGLPLVRKASSYVRQARQPMPDRAAAYNLLEHIGPHRLLTAALLDAIDAGAPLALQRRIYARCDARSSVDRELAYDWRFTLSDNDLPKVIGSAQLAGVRTAFPLLDDAVVDLSLRLLPSQKVRGLQLRHFFKSALADFLPAEILRKKKHGFGLPFGPWLVRDRRLADFSRTAIEGLVDRGIVRPEVPADVFERFLPQHPKFYGEVVWILAVLECWLRAHAPQARFD